MIEEWHQDQSCFDGQITGAKSQPLKKYSVGVRMKMVSVAVITVDNTVRLVFWGLEIIFLVRYSMIDI
jgi:hypothetical protein